MRLSAIAFVIILGGSTPAFAQTAPEPPLPPPGEEAVDPYTVSNDNAVRLAGAPVIDIPPSRRRKSFAKARVEVRQLLHGSWRVYLGDELIATADGTVAPGELRPLKGNKKRSAAARAFRRGVQRL